MLNEGWCLVLAVWGEKYADAFVNVIAASVRRQSPGCTGAILFTDRIREGIDADIEQKLFPPFFRQQKFMGHGYLVKLSVFSRADLPPRTRCVYLDLDTVVVGDVGRLAALIDDANDYRMLPPGNIAGFGPLRRLLFRLTDGRKFATGNSSIMAYSSAAEPNLCEGFQKLYESGEADGRYMQIDDVFISWFAQLRLKKVPATLGVPFRREFLSKSRAFLWLKNRSPAVRRRRDNLVAITFNGVKYKPDVLMRLSDGHRIVDDRGRIGYWSAAYLGPAREKIIRFCESVSGR